MKFKINQKTLDKNISNVISAVNNSAHAPILQNIKIDVVDNRVKLTASDMDTSIESSFDCDDIESGSTTVNASIFSNVVKKYSKDSDISFLQDESGMFKISQGRSKFKIPTLPSEDYPAISSNNLDVNFQIESSQLITAINKCSKTICKDPTRFSLNGLCVKFDNESKSLKFISTDGVAMSFFEVDNQDIDSDFNIIIPNNSISSISKILKNDDIINISLSDKKLKISCGDTSLITKLIDGEFPNVEAVIPKDNNEIIKINRLKLLSSLDRIMVSAKNNSLVKFNFNDNGLSLDYTSGNFSANEMIDLESSNNIELGYNGKILIDILQLLDSVDIDFAVKDKNTPLLIREGNSQYVVSPIRF